MFRDLAALETAHTIDTPFGPGILRLTKDRTVVFELVEPTKINGVLYMLQGSVYLNLRTEEPHVRLDVRRAAFAERTPYWSRNWTILPNSTPTPAARDRAYDVLEPLLSRWYEDNFASVEAGHFEALRLRVEQANIILDECAKTIEQRRQQLLVIADKIAHQQRLTQAEDHLISDLYGSSWRMFHNDERLHTPGGY